MAYRCKVRIDVSRPGKPTDNAVIETFNGSLRDECLNLHWFETMVESQGRHRGLAAGPQREPPSNGPWPQDATEISFADRQLTPGNLVARMGGLSCLRQMLWQ